ncbi:MAG: hypothetical protein M3332_13610 [Actinomycetota bacterium]|nr:hypothetical protein [Actinomycetota bacterium]
MTRNILTSSTQVPGDTEISGGNLTEREMPQTGLQPLKDPVAHLGTSGLYGNQTLWAGQVARADAGLPATRRRR